MEKKRLVEVDILRGLAIIAVVGIHATSTSLQFTMLHAGTASIVVNQLINQLFRYATPLFLLLSGLVLALSQQARPLHALTFYKKRFIKILIPYVAWSIFLGIIAGPVTQETVVQIGKNILTGNADYQLYFVILLLQCYLLFPVLFALVHRSSHKLHGKVVLYAFAVQTLLLTLYMVERLRGENINVEFAFRFFALWIFYFLLGIVCAFHLPRIASAIKQTSLALLIILFCISAILLTIEVRFLHIPYYEQLNFFRPSVVYHTVIASILLYKVATILVEQLSAKTQAIQNFLVLLGRHSFGIFLIHTLIMRLSLTYVGILFPSLFFTAVLFFMSLLASIGILVCYEKLLQLLPVTIRITVRKYV